MSLQQRHSLRKLELKLQESLSVNCHLALWKAYLFRILRLDGTAGSPGTVYYRGPNHISNTTIGNVFQGALRVGFLFD